MLKRSLIGLALAGLLGTFVFGREAVSYVRTGLHNIRGAVKAEVPVKFEIERAQTLVNQLGPDIRLCMHSVAEQQVDIENRRTTLAQKEADLNKQKEAILTLRSDVKSGKPAFVYASHSYTASDVKRDLASRFERFKAAEEVLSADRQILAAREKTLAANREKLDNLLKSRKEIEVQLEQLQARANTVNAAEAVSKLSIDDSNLSNARKLISELNKQLDVKQKMLDVEGKFVGLIPVESTAPVVTADIDKQIDAYFGEASEATISSSVVSAE
ncbi:MAG: hypothetical protein WCH39_14750 [Schlesneria sp.]